MQVLTKYPKYSINRMGQVINNTTLRQLVGNTSGGGYLQVRISDENNKFISIHIHRLMKETFLYPGIPINERIGLEIDHINGIRDDNRIENLRLATRTQNLRNRDKFKSNNKYKGVYPLRDNKGFVLKFNNKYKGIYDCEHEAAEEYNRLGAIEYGIFFKPNIIVQ